MIADLVWSYFGDVDSFCEPFCGSSAVLLARPYPGKAETINDASGLVTNCWRSIQSDPETVAKLCDQPINELDLFARHVALVKAAPRLTDALMSDPEYYDAKLAAWWIWGASSWIGSGWCAGVGPWSVEDGRVVKTEQRGVNKKMPIIGAQRTGDVSTAGIHAAKVRRKIPSIGANDSGSAGYRGVNRKMPIIGARRENTETPYSGIHGQQYAGSLLPYFRRLAARLRNVRVVCGDWGRILSPRITTAFGIAAIFMDPPYPGTNEEFYGEHGDTDVWHAAQQWAIANGANPQLRIALCGLDDQTMPSDWTAVRWKRAGGYGSQGDGAGRANASREVVWFNKSCLDPQAEAIAKFSTPIIAADSDDYGPLWGDAPVTLGRLGFTGEAAKAQLEAGTFAGQPSMIDCLERIVRRGENR